jgi:hypothetical protein
MTKTYTVAKTRGFYEMQQTESYSKLQITFCLLPRGKSAIFRPFVHFNEQYKEFYIIVSWVVVTSRKCNFVLSYFYVPHGFLPLLSISVLLTSSSRLFVHINKYCFSQYSYSAWILYISGYICKKMNKI